MISCGVQLYFLLSKDGDEGKMFGWSIAIYGGNVVGPVTDIDNGKDNGST